MPTRFTTIQIVSQIRTELDRLIDTQSGMAGDLVDGPVVPTRVDIVEMNEMVCVLIELPGVASEDLQITVAGTQLTVAGEKHTPGRAAEGSRFLCIERQWGRFERCVELPATVNSRRGRAVLDHGVLRIDFPVLSEQRNRPFRLEVQNADGGELE